MLASSGSTDIQGNSVSVSSGSTGPTTTPGFSCGRQRTATLTAPRKAPPPDAVPDLTDTMRSLKGFL